MTEQTNQVVTDITQFPRYAALFNHLADLVENSDAPAVAAVGLLNATVAIWLSMYGPDVTAKTLRDVADRVPSAAAEARRTLT